MMKVLIVEDDLAIIELLKYTLQQEGIEVLVAMDGKTAVDISVAYMPDIIIMDWMLPEQSGIYAIKEIRKKSDGYIPIIMLTARCQEEDKIQSLDIGADDYVTKPFSPKELVARIKAVLRCKQGEQRTSILSFKDITVNINAHTVERAGTPIKLGAKEYALFLHFIKNPKRVFSREQLLNSVWKTDSYVDLRTVDVHITRLRKALKSNKIIQTVWSVGYKLGTDT